MTVQHSVKLDFTLDHFGVDEAGRGCCAGPFYVAAVKYPSEITEMMRDSKRVSPARREVLCDHIVANARYAVCGIEPQWIDAHGIQEAQKVGLYNVINLLAGSGTMTPDYPHFVVADGTPSTWSLHNEWVQHEWKDRLVFMVKADDKVQAVSAASILAKTMRDRVMEGEMHVLYPQYNFKKHKGYNTPEHLEALDRFGSCAIHRHTFKNVERVDASKS